MTDRRALIIAPLYDGKLFPALAGRPHLIQRLMTCLSKYGKYDIKVLDGFVEQSLFRQTIYDFFDIDGELLFYFYGHGCLRPPAMGVFATSDASLHNEGVLMEEVTALAQASKAREAVLILDCCHAGAANPVTSFTLGMLATQLVPNVGRDLLAACASHQQGWTAKNTDGQLLGAFSTYVLQGLEGAACGMGPARTKVRGSTLGTYVTEVFQVWNQDPVIQLGETGTHHCVITSDLPKNTILKSKGTTSTWNPLTIGVPFKPSHLFVGRSAEIDTLLTMLVDGRKPVAVSATVEGLGGIGKTELVLQLIHHPDIQKTYSTIIWLDGAGPIPPQWEKIAAEINVKMPATRPTDLLPRIEREFQKRGNTLIVLDNAADWDALHEFIPPGMPLLITTRTHGFGGNSFRHVELAVLSDDAATSLLTQTVPELKEDPSLSRLVYELAGHALALELAAWNIRYQGLSATEYIERLNKHQGDSSHALTATRYGRTVGGCLAITWDGLHLDASRALWRRAALFAPVSAHRELLGVSFRGDSRIAREVAEEIYWLIRRAPNSLRRLYSRAFAYTSRDFDEAYTELRACHVLSRIEGFNGERWGMHRLVRDYGRARIQPGEVMIHSMALSEWLRHPTLPLTPEVPHFIAAILDTARYSDELSILNGRYVGRELLHRSIGDQERLLLDPRAFIRFIRDELQDPKALTMILEGLTDINEDVRIRAIELLESIEPIPEVLEGLTASLSDPDSLIRARAGEVLAKYGGERTIHLLCLTAKGSNERARLEAIRTLGQMGPEAYVALKDGLTSNDQSVRVEAALLLCEQGQKEGIELLIQVIKSIPKQEQNRLIAALGETRDPGIIPTLLDFLPSARHRIHAIEALGKIIEGTGPISEVLETLAALLGDSDSEVRVSAGNALAKCNAEKTITILKMVLNTPNTQARLQAIRTLGQMKVSAYILNDALNNNDQSVRVEAALLLCEQGENKGTALLTEVLQSASEAQQQFIVRVLQALGKTKDQSFYPTLAPFLKSHNYWIREAAEESIRKLGIPKNATPTKTSVKSNPASPVEQKKTRVAETSQQTSSGEEITPDISDGGFYVITQPCIGVKDASCVDVCPVDCIHPTSNEPEYDTAEKLHINPDECISCGACEPACPVTAIFEASAVPQEWKQHIKISAEFFKG